MTTTPPTYPALFFGCWKTAGHHLFAPGGSSVYYADGYSIEYVTREVHLDSGLAPKSWRAGITCTLLVTDPAERQRLHYDGHELPQGQFLRLLHGEHTSEVMVAEFRKHFPHVVANLDKAGVALVEVFPS